MGLKPKTIARRLLNKYCYECPDDINLEELIYAEKLNLKFEPLSECQGKIIFSKNEGIITIDSGITNRSRVRFIAGHEMGHFFLERNLCKPVQSSEVKVVEGRDIVEHLDRNVSTGNLWNSRLRELRANQFASELLMPEPWFKEQVANKRLTVNMLGETAAYFGMSLSATAFRYAELGEIPCAIIFSKDGKVEWSKLHDQFPFRNCPKGKLLSDDSSKAYMLNQAFKSKRRNSSITTQFFSHYRNSDAGLYPAEEGLSGTVSAYTWFDDAVNHWGVFLNEENAPMRQYNSTLTVLTLWKG